MQLPPILPKHLEYLRNVQEPNQVFSELIQDTHKLVDFFEVVADDDVWINRNPDFITKIIAWFTQQYTQGKLGTDLSDKVAEIIFSRYSTLKTLIPHNITLKSGESSYLVNSLLFGTASPIFKDLIRDELWSKNTTTLHLKAIPENDLKKLIEYINEGTLENLWKQSKDEIIQTLRFAEQWDIKKLEELCQISLHRYIDNQSVVSMLVEAQKEKWDILKIEAIDFFNSLEHPLKVVKTYNSEFPVEFLNFRTNTLDIFKKFSTIVTHLVCRGELSQDRTFIDIMQNPPRLIGVDVSDSYEFSSNLLEIPSKIEEFTAARSPWINNDTLKILINATPQMVKVKIPGAIQLTTNGWADLRRWAKLEHLDLAHCHQLQDRDLQIIINGCENLRELSLEDCRAITENGFNSLAKPFSKIARLNLSRTNLSQAAFVEIVDKSNNLEMLNISRCNIPSELIHKIKRDNPKLDLISD